MLGVWRSSVTCSLFKSKQTEHESAVILQIPARFYTRIFVLSVIFDLFYSLACYIRGVFAELKNNLFGWSKLILYCKGPDSQPEA